MAERLTIKNSDGTYSQPTDTTFEKVFNKLAQIEDILEKYDLEVEELDERIYNGAMNYVDKLKAEADRDTWKRACALASETLKQVMGKPLWIGGNIPTPEVKDSDYFYQQAKKEKQL